MCHRFNELSLWEKFEDEHKHLAEGSAEMERARAERKRVIEEIAVRTFDPGLKNCVTSCKRGGEASQAACMEKAETAAAARVCFEE